MTVDRLEPLDRQRSKVFVDGDFAFVLYRGEIRKLHIEEGETLEGPVYRRIMEEILPKRARERSLHYLQARARTESEVLRKLREGYYPEEVAAGTVEFLKKYRYLDDEEYVRNYMEYSGSRKSRAEIFRFLAGKGIPKSMMKEIFEEQCPDTGEAIRGILKKRRYDPETATPEEKRRTETYLIRRGFSYDDISECLT